MRPPSAGVFVLFHHEDPCAFGHYKAIAVHVDWTRSTLRCVVPGVGHDPHQRKALHNSKSQGSIHSARQNHWEASKLDLAKSVSEAIRGRSTARSDHMAHSAKSEAHVDLAGKCPHGSAGNAEQTDL